MNPIRGNRIFSNGIGGVGANGVGLAIDLGNGSTPAARTPTTSATPTAPGANSGTTSRTTR